MLIVAFCFVCYGIAANIVYNDTLKKWTDTPALFFFHELFSCIKCTGFWVGLFVSVFFVIQFDLLYEYQPQWLVILFGGFLSSGACWFLDGLRRE